MGRVPTSGVSMPSTSRGEGEHPENREQTHQSSDPDQALSTSYDLLLQDGTYARSCDWAVHQIDTNPTDLFDLESTALRHLPPERRGTVSRSRDVLPS